MITILSTEGCFCAGLAGYTVLIGAQLSLPLLRFFNNLFHSTVHCKPQLRSAAICQVEKTSYVKVTRPVNGTLFNWCSKRADSQS